MKSFSFILLVVCGFAAGVFCGGEARVRTDRFKIVAADSTPIATESRTGYDLEALLDWKSMDAAGGAEIVGQLKRLDTDAIWNLLLVVQIYRFPGLLMLPYVNPLQALAANQNSLFPGLGVSAKPRTA